MSSQNSKPITIPPELEAEMTPAVRAFVGILLDRIAMLVSVHGVMECDRTAADVTEK